MHVAFIAIHLHKLSYLSLSQTVTKTQSSDFKLSSILEYHTPAQKVPRINIVAYSIIRGIRFPYSVPLLLYVS